MVTWPEVFLALGGPVVGAVVTVVGLAVQRRFARSDRSADEARALRERAANVVGPLRTLVVESEPDRLGINVSERSGTIMADLRGRWQPLREELGTVSLLYAGESFRVLADAIAVAVSNTLTSTEWFLADLLRKEAHEMNSRAMAKANYARASGLVDLLADHVVGRAGGNELETRRAEIEREHAEAGKRGDV